MNMKESSQTEDVGIPKTWGHGMRKVLVPSVVVGAAMLFASSCTPPAVAPVPLTSTTVTAGNDTSGAATISSNGNVVVFASKATNLTAGTDANGSLADVFAYDRSTGVTERLTNGNGASGAENNSPAPSPFEDPSNVLTTHNAIDVSADGRYVAFTSRATDLTATATTPGLTNAYRYDRQTHTTELVAAPSGCPAWATIDNMFDQVAISTDGNVVATSRGCSGYDPDGVYSNLYYIRVQHVGGTAVDFPLPGTVAPSDFIYNFMMSGDASVVDIITYPSYQWTRLTVATGSWSAPQTQVWPMSVSHDGRYLAVFDLNPSHTQLERIDTVTNHVDVISTTLWSGAVLSDSGQYAAVQGSTSATSASGAFVTTEQYGRWEVGAGIRPIATGERTYVSPPATWTGGTAWTAGTSVADDGSVAYARRTAFATPSMQIAIATS